jgi:hypothetical protein
VLRIGYVAKIEPLRSDLKVTGGFAVGNYSRFKIGARCPLQLSRTISR